jgi:alkanesulfonate monooxygenase SsuD/methylene tetrahydromethanopterin reductase-like flavin-dependent oxidoreductase (luciferase family)
VIRIGVSLRSGYGSVDPRVGARWMVERAAAARAAGLDSMFVGDHHVTGSTYFQNVPILGRVLAEWGDRPAGALFLLPLWHPVLLAEQVGTLAALAEGPFVVQLGLGAGEDQFGGMGVPLRGRVERFEAALDVVRRLLAGEEVSAEEPFGIRGARIGPLPDRPVDVWIGAGAPAGIDRAARLADGWIAGPWVALDEARDQLERYRSRCEAHGRAVGVAAIRRDVHVGADAADAHRVADPVLVAGYRGLPADAPIVGGPEEVAEAIVGLGQLGYTDVLVRHLAEDQGEVLASFERLAPVLEIVRQELVRRTS